MRAGDLSAPVAAILGRIAASTTREPLGPRAHGRAGGLLAVALLIGAGAGGFAILFRWLITTFTVLFTGHTDYAATPGAANPHLPALGRWFVVLAPVVAGLIYGPLVHFFAREARGHGVPEVMYAVARRGGRIAPRVAAVKALASALCIGGGGSVGREGPIVQIGSALGSTVGIVARAPEGRMRLFVACGAAGGIAATFNAPLAGVFFALELILADFTTSAFGLVVISAVTSAAIGRMAFGNASFLHLPAFTVTHPGEYLLYAVLGVLSGVVGVAFTKVLYLIEDGCDSVWRGPEWLRPAVGGLALGLLLLVLPQMYGVGYPVLGKAVGGGYALWFLLLLLVGKMVATSLTIGIGGSGGVFAPSLFIGAMLGSAYGYLAQELLPNVAGAAGAYGLIGMGAVFAGAARAPITAVIILFELTGEYSIILPLMAAIVVATAVSHRLGEDSIYTLKLRRRGIDLSVPVTPAQKLRVATAMVPLPSPLRASASLAAAAAQLSRAAYGVLPVTDDDGRFRGILTARAVADALAEGHESTDRAAIITELPARIRSDDTLETALQALTLTGCGAIPVFPADGSDQPAGWITYPTALAAL
ncbi:chloride channel protein [Intrasporangium chromatireducens Q5-1]|uniref:Chloride channel protein n=1 Tax=Intrasporangium chromatireducens Q5-1 TaxID=584657 RepID=W9GP76_9MICO|nr:chloride channel protein [Intrasporangium chromatireducens]EWT06882.1 chloride channel protein [Intrasporangium chromatireducens Q5-1]